MKRVGKWEVSAICAYKIGALVATVLFTTSKYYRGELETLVVWLHSIYL